MNERMRDCKLHQDQTSTMLLSLVLAIAFCLPITSFAQKNSSSSILTPAPQPRQLPFAQRYDEFLSEAVEKHGLVGGALSVTKNGKLVYARGFGLSRIEDSIVAAPTTSFRIGSISKPITAVAVLQLVQNRKLQLDDHVVDILAKDFISTDSIRDDRIKLVKIRHLLNHSSGWDPGFDVMADANINKIASAKSVRSREIRPRDVVAYMFTQMLDHDPGTHFAYSNFGYCVLGRVVEAVSGQSYEEYVRQHVLTPVGITKMYVGTKEPAEGESYYYDRQRPENSSDHCNGFASVSLYDSHGGWVGSCIDLVRFACDFDIPQRSRTLSQVAVEAMFSTPLGPLGINDRGMPRNDYYAFGWEGVQSRFSGLDSICWWVCERAGAS